MSLFLLRVAARRRGTIGEERNRSNVGGRGVIREGIVYGMVVGISLHLNIPLERGQFPPTHRAPVVSLFVRLFVRKKKTLFPFPDP